MLSQKGIELMAHCFEQWYPGEFVAPSITHEPWQCVLDPHHVDVGTSHVVRVYDVVPRYVAADGDDWIEQINAYSIVWKWCKRVEARK